MFRQQLLIIDQTLVGFDGHHYEYDLAVAEAAQRGGLRVVIGGNRRLPGDLPFAAGELRPWFRHAWFEANQAPATRLALGVIGAMPQALRRPAKALGITVKRCLAARRPALFNPVAAGGSDFGQELLFLIGAERLTPADDVLIHTISIPELDSLIAAVSGAGALPRIHIVLRRDANEPAVSSGSRSGISGSFAAVCRSPLPRRTLRFYADTEELSEQYRGIAGGLTIATLPIPHPLSPPTAAARKQGPVVVSYLGNARREKGFHLLPQLVEAVAPDLLAENRAAFVIQSNFNFEGGEKGIAEARRRLQSYHGRGVRLIKGALPPERFQAELAASDIVLLPYDPRDYRRRSSGLLVQAMALGCVTIVPAGTWLARQPAGSAVIFADPADLPRALRDAIRRLPELRHAAAVQAPSVRAHHNAAQLLQILLP